MNQIHEAEREKPMRSIHIPASRAYEVLIGGGLLDEAGTRIRRVTESDRAAIVAGEKVLRLYGERLLDTLGRAGFQTVFVSHPGGEEHKNLESYGALLRFLSENRLSRADVLISLGGGVTGDLAGFTAATYQRGMSFVQIPTTLLAMVDASVGGKTALNLPTGKNQVGCFYQPSLVLCDPEVLSTLPEDEFHCGMAEVIKYAMLGDPELMDLLLREPIEERLAQLIARCVEMKRNYVAADEYDRGSRQLLNLGHSFGHALERCSAGAIRHGEAVSIGMVMAARAALARGICDEETVQTLVTALRRYALPTEPAFSARELSEAMLADKKRSGERLRLVLPEAVGRCRIESVPINELDRWLCQGGAR